MEGRAPSRPETVENCQRELNHGGGEDTEFNPDDTELVPPFRTPILFRVFHVPVVRTVPLRLAVGQAAASLSILLAVTSRAR